MGLVKQPLYKITEAFHTIDNMINNGDIQSEDIVDQIELMDLEFEQKAVQVAIVRQNMKPVIEGIDVEIKRLKARKQALENRSKSLSDYLQVNMVEVGKTQIKHDLFNITLCKGREVVTITDQDQLPPELVKVSVVEKVDNNSLLRLLKEQARAIEQAEQEGTPYEGELIKGATLDRSKSYIQVK